MKKTFKFSILMVMSIMAIAACTKKKGTPLSVYPNPATTYIVFDATESGKYKNGEIKIKDVQGNVLKVFRTQDNSRIRWQIDSLERGVYHYSYTADKMKEQTGKVVFE